MGYKTQRKCYIGHNCKHVLKFQALNSRYGLIIHLYRSMENHIHDLNLYRRSALDGVLKQMLEVDGRNYSFFGYSRYNHRDYIKVPYQGGNMTPKKCGYNNSMSLVKITVKWVLKEVLFCVHRPQGKNDDLREPCWYDVPRIYDSS